MLLYAITPLRLFTLPLAGHYDIEDDETLDS